MVEKNIVWGLEDLGTSPDPALTAQEIFRIHFLVCKQATIIKTILGTALYYCKIRYYENTLSTIKHLSYVNCS